MLGRNTLNQALKRNVTIFKWTLSLLKCLEVHLTSTKSILGRNDPFLYIMSRSCRTMSWTHIMMSYRVTTDLNRYPKLVESYFSLGFSYYPPISDTAFFSVIEFLHIFTFITFS